MTSELGEQSDQTFVIVDLQECIVDDMALVACLLDELEILRVLEECNAQAKHHEQERHLVHHDRPDRARPVHLECQGINHRATGQDQDLAPREELERAHEDNLDTGRAHQAVTYLYLIPNMIFHTTITYQQNNIVILLVLAAILGAFIEGDPRPKLHHAVPE